MSRVGHLVVAVTALAISLSASIPAMANGTLLYLTGSGEPVAGMSLSSLPGGGLPNYDPDRDSEPGLLLARSSEGANENDPAKHQDWVYDASGLTMSTVHLKIWAATQDFNPGEIGRFGVYVMDCGTSCSVLKSATAMVPASQDWTRLTVATTVSDHTFASGHSLVVRVVVLDNSDDDMVLAYGTSGYDAHLRLSQPPAQSTTTTTTSTTSTTAPTTTTSTSTPAANPGGSPSPGQGGGQGPPVTLPSSAVGGPLPAGEVSTTTLPAAETPVTTSGSSPTPSSSGDGGSGGVKSSATTSIPIVDQPTPVVFAAAAHPVVAEVFETPRDLRPAEGLMVAFATVAESVELYWQAAVGLGSVAAGLLWVGLSGKQGWDVNETP